jgi:hypothetical protein
MIEEAKMILTGKAPDVPSVEFSGVKEIEVDDYTVQSLMDDARAKVALEERVRQSVDKLKEMVGD